VITKTNTKKISFRNKIIIAILLVGMVFFGFILPDSLGDHDKMVHFAAHFGMSFLISCLIYAFSRYKLHLKIASSYFLVIGITLVLGSVYKWMELISQGKLASFQVSKLFQVSGYYTSMSQNISGILATFLMFTYFFRKAARIPSLTFVNRVNGNNHPVGIDNRRNLAQDF
jgi:hypothetical protein